MKFSGTILGCLLLCHSAGADITMTMKDMGDSRNDGDITTLMVSDGKVKMQESGEGTAMIYDSAANTFSAVDHKRKMVMVMDEEAASAVTDQMAQAMKQMEAQMASLPEAQRKMLMEQMKTRMPGMGGGSKPKKTTVSWTGDTREVAGYKCKVAKLTDGSGEVSQACVAERKALGISEEDFETMASMMDAMTDMAGPFAENVQIPSLREIDGVPISSESENQQSELVSVSKDSIAAEEFVIPSDYKQQSMAGM